MSAEFKLKDLVKKYKIVPKKKLGQNFIFDSNVLNKIVNNILPIKNYNVIEIGPGPGGLTLAILKKTPKKIIVIEKDPAFKEILTKILSEFNNIKSSIIIDDFLNLNLDKFIKSKTKILSNLPYYISSQILIKILPLNRYVQEVMLTFQKELANRIISKPNNKNYSRLSVVVQSVCDIKKHQKISSQVFFPIPKVDSTILVFTKKENQIVKNFETLKYLTKIAFNKRRKSIKNSLKSLQNISKYLKELNIDENSRPEQISVEKFCQLANLIYLTKK